MKQAAALIVLFLTGLAAAVAVAAAGSTAAPSGQSGAFTYTARVFHVVDGDSFHARLSNGREEEIALLGVKTPARGECLFVQSARRTSALTNGVRVTLRGDRSQPTRDRAGRLNAYADLRGSQDLALRLIREGLAVVQAPRNGFARLARYRAAQATAKSSKVGLWGACAPAERPEPTPPPPPTTPSQPTEPPTTTNEHDH